MELGVHHLVYTWLLEFAVSSICCMRRESRRFDMVKIHGKTMLSSPCRISHSPVSRNTCKLSCLPRSSRNRARWCQSRHNLRRVFFDSNGGLPLNGVQVQNSSSITPPFHVFVDMEVPRAGVTLTPDSNGFAEGHEAWSGAVCGRARLKTLTCRQSATALLEVFEKTGSARFAEQPH